MEPAEMIEMDSHIGGMRDLAHNFDEWCHKEYQRTGLYDFLAGQALIRIYADKHEPFLDAVFKKERRVV